MNTNMARIIDALQVTVASDSPAARSLLPGQAASLPTGRARTVSCRSGWLWLTRQGDAEDHVLVAGESLSLPAAGKVVLSCPQGGSYSLA